MPKTSVVVPNWNGADFLRPCLDSLLSQTDADRQIAVVDNGSVDDSKTIVRSYPDVRLIELDQNYGFTGGVNPGIEQAIRDNSEFVALFNNDAVAAPDWLANLVKDADTHPEAGIITGKFLQTDRRHIDSTGDFMSVWGFAFPRGRDETDEGQYDQSEEVFAGSGGASLYRVEMLKQIGLFDQDFFAYFEDQDIAFRAQLAGWRVRYQPKAVAYHTMGGTSSRLNRQGADRDQAATQGSDAFRYNDFARYHTVKNFSFLYLKNMPGWLFWKYLPRYCVSFSLICLNSVKRRQLKPLVAALGQMTLKKPRMLAKRRRIQAARRVPVSYIDSILFHGMPPTQKGLLRLARLFSLKRS